MSSTELAVQHQATSTAEHWRGLKLWCAKASDEQECWNGLLNHPLMNNDGGKR